MARSPFPRLFPLLLSALALILIGMEGAAAAAPTGWLDAASCTSVNGWACDPDYPNAINVQIYVDGGLKTQVLANDIAADAAAIKAASGCGGTGNYRWHWDIPYTEYFGLGLHTVNAYPIGVDSGGTPDGENPELSGSPKSPTCTGEWHCCDLRAVDPPGLWYPSPPACALIGSDCILDPAVYNFCGLGAGDYETRSFWPPPPDAIQQSDLKPYWCIVPLNHSSMDLGASGPVVPCNTSAACADDGNCYNTFDTSRNADGDLDNDYCLSGTWYDCLNVGQCPAGSNCVGNDCTEINCIDGIDNDGDTKIDELDSDCCSWCEDLPNAWFDSNAPGPETPVGCGSPFSMWELGEGFQQQWCCGNSPDEAYEICEYLDLPGNDKVSWASSCTSDDDGCCLSPGCVDPAANVCYDASSGYDIPSQSSSDSFSYCSAGGVWQDCDNSSGICGGCAGVAGFPCAGGASCWANGGESAAFGEYDTGTATECCGDDPSEYFNRSIYHPSIESPPPATVACCNALTDCVNGSACYTNAATADVDSNGDADVCSAGTWLDCSADGAPQCPAGLCCAVGNCTPCSSEVGKCDDDFDNDLDGYVDEDDPDCCSWCEENAWFDSNAPGPETPVGCGSPFSMWELGEGFQQQWCCGNNVTTEFYKVYFDNPSIIACCNATTDCVDGTGTCRNGTEYSPGGCTDDDDHDCDGKHNFDDEDCRAALYGTVTEDDGTTAIPNATVTAVATDPVTVMVVQYSNVTNTDGDYLMNVTKGLDYDIVVVVPGYGTGFVWDNGPGEINFSIKKAENCEDDCTSPGENWCRPDCQGINYCSFYDYLGDDGAGAMRTCEGAQKDWILPFSSTQDIQCCEGEPIQRKRTQVVGVSGAESVVRVTRIISYAGQLITLVIDVFK